MAKAKIKKNAVVLTSRDMLNGYIAGNTETNIFHLTPIQMVCESEKDEDWKKWNLDWFERAGMRQLSYSSKKILGNYDLANGIINKSDYIIGPDNDMSERIATLSSEADNLPIRFFPIIPNIVNLLCGEFSKRDRRIIVKAVDNDSIQEAYDYKMDMVRQIMTQHTIAKRQQELQKMGMDFESEDPQVQEQIQSEMELAKKFAEVQLKFKNYRSIPEKWANAVIESDNQRFDMYQLEGKAFRDMLVSDREFWHVKIKEDDYEVEVWEPWNTFYHKSPSTEYIADGNYVGRVRMMSLADVIDSYGDKMEEDQIEGIKEHYKTFNNIPLVTDQLAGQESWYNDNSKPYPQNYVNVTWQKWLNGEAGKVLNGGKSKYLESNNTWFDIEKSGQYYQDIDTNGPGLVRVTEVYWKSQKKVFELTWIKKDGTIVNDIVDEKYKVTFKPVYDTSLNKAKTKQTLIEGEHLDAIWINEVRWGVKINSSTSSFYTRNYSDYEPIYIGGDPIPFQFKGQNNLYGCKLPVEGRIFSERGSSSSSLVDKMKGNQISFNIVNNQINEFLADEVGNVIVIDPNSIPRNSLGGEWGKHNYSNFFQVMKNYQVAPVDNSLRNTEVPTNFSHFQTVDLSKTNQIMSRISLAEYFKNEAFAVVGVTPQRLGSVAASETATGTTQAVNNSYAQTEPYVDAHLNHLMPRVRQMMINAAQFINATKPQSRITYLNEEEQNVFFQLEGYKTLLPEFQILAKSTADVKELRQKLEQLAMQTIPAGGSLVDAARMMSMKSAPEIIEKLEQAEDKRNQDIQAQRDHEQQMQQMQQQFIEQQEAKSLENENYWKERDIEKEIYIAEIKALGYAKDQDLNANNIPDPLEVSKFLYQQGIDSQDQMAKIKDIEQRGLKIQNDAMAKQQDLAMRQKELASREKIEKMKLRNPVAGERKK